MKMLTAFALFLTFFFSTVSQAGTIVISYKQRTLSLYEGNQIIAQFRVAVPKPQYAWIGQETTVQRMQRNPRWVAPAEVLRYHPELVNGAEAGSPHNPMGVAAIELGLTEIAIHGTTNTMRKSIGSAASFGCIRMRNEDINKLYELVSVGTRVMMVN